LLSRYAAIINLRQSSYTHTHCTHNRWRLVLGWVTTKKMCSSLGLAWDIWRDTIEILMELNWRYSLHDFTCFAWIVKQLGNSNYELKWIWNVLFQSAKSDAESEIYRQINIKIDEFFELGLLSLISVFLLLPILFDCIIYFCKVQSSPISVGRGV